jgi:hypothetical protein
VQSIRVSLFPRASSGGAGESQGATITIEEFLKFQTEQEQIALQHIKLYMRYLKRDFHLRDIAFDKEKTDFVDLPAKSDSIAKEHSGANVEGFAHLRPIQGSTF